MADRLPEGVGHTSFRWQVQGGVGRGGPRAVLPASCVFTSFSQSSNLHSQGGRTASPRRCWQAALAAAAGELAAAAGGRVLKLQRRSGRPGRLRLVAHESKVLHVRQRVAASVAQRRHVLRQQVWLGCPAQAQADELPKHLGRGQWRLLGGGLQGQGRRRGGKGQGRGGARWGEGGGGRDAWNRCTGGEGRAGRRGLAQGSKLGVIDKSWEGSVLSSPCA